MFNAYLRSLAIPHPFQIDTKHCIEIVRTHFSCLYYVAPDSSAVEADIQSSESCHRLFNRRIDLIFFAAISCNLEYLDRWVKLKESVSYIGYVSLVEINESDTLDSVSLEHWSVSICLV